MLLQVNFLFEYLMQQWSTTKSDKICFIFKYCEWQYFCIIKESKNGVDEVPLISTLTWINCRNGFVGLLVLCLMLALNPQFIVKISPVKVCFVDICFESISRRSSTGESDGWHKLSVIRPRCYKGVPE